MTKLLTKTKLLKKLKLFGNDNLEFIQGLKNENFDFLLTEGRYWDLFEGLTDRRRSTVEKKVAELVTEMELSVGHNQERIDVLKQDIRDQVKYCDQPKAMEVLVEHLLNQNMTEDQLYCFNLQDILMTTDADEYISRSASASVWTFYVEG